MLFNTLLKFDYLKKTPYYTYVEFILFGLNYSFRRLSRRKIRFNLQYGDHFNVLLPTSVIARVFKRRLVLFGNKNILKPWLKTIMLLRYPNDYTGKGLRLRTSSYKVKAGKERKK